MKELFPYMQRGIFLLLLFFVFRYFLFRDIRTSVPPFLWYSYVVTSLFMVSVLHYLPFRGILTSLSLFSWYPYFGTPLLWYPYFVISLFVMSLLWYFSFHDKGDNEMILESVHRSPGICLKAEENPRKPQLGDRLMLCDKLSPKWGPLPPNQVGRIAQHVRKGEGKK